MLKNIFELDSVGSLMDPESKWYSFSVDDKLMDGLHTLLNFFFQMLKLCVAGVDFSIRTFFKMDILGSRLSTVFESGSKIFDSVYSTFGIVFLTIVLILIVRDFFTKGLQKVLLRLGLFIMIVLVSAIFFNSGSKLVSDINIISNDAQTKLMKVASPVNSKYTDELLDKFGLEKKEGIEGVRNMMYATFVYQPYALMNFGTTDISKAKYTDYLIKKNGDVEERQDEIGDKVTDSSKKNSYLTVRKLADKYVVLLNASINFTIVGLAVFCLALGNLLIQLMIYMLIFLFGIILMIALLPDKENVLFNGLKGLLTLFGMKVLLGLGFGLLFTVINLIDGLFTELTIVSVLVSLVIKILVFIFVWKKWGNIVAFLNGSSSISDLSMNPTEMKDMYTKRQSKKRRKKNDNRSDEQFELQRTMLENQVEESEARLDMSKDYRDNMRLHANDADDSMNDTARFTNDSDEQDGSLNDGQNENPSSMTIDDAGTVNEDDSTDPSMDVDLETSADDLTGESNGTSDYRSPDDILLADVDDEDFNVESNDDIADNRTEDMIYEEEQALSRSEDEVPVETTDNDEIASHRTEDMVHEDTNDVTSLESEKPLETTDNDEIASHRTEDMVHEDTNGVTSLESEKPLETIDNDEIAHNRGEDIISDEAIQTNSIEDTLPTENQGNDDVSSPHIEDTGTDEIISHGQLENESSIVSVGTNDSDDSGVYNVPVQDETVLSHASVNEQDTTDLGINNTSSDKEVSSPSTINDNDGASIEESVQPVNEIDSQDIPSHDTDFKEVRSDLDNESS